MTGRRCIGFDRVIDADRPIDGTCPAQASDGAADWSIRWRPPAARPHAEPPIWSGDRATLRFSPVGIAEYRLAPARIPAEGPASIEVTPVAGGPAGWAEALLIATALPALLWLEGAFMLHAAAIVPPGGDGGGDGDGALAIAGPSGCGKSRLAAAMVARGAALVADDSVALRWDGDRPVAAGLGGGYHLGAPGQEERPFHPLPADRARRSAPLAAVVVLDEGRGTARLGGVAALAALLANRHRAGVPRFCGLEPGGLADAARLARVVPVYRWSRAEADALHDPAIRATIMGQGDGR